LEPQKTEIVYIESTVGCFKDLNQEDLEFLSLNKTQIDYQKGDTIFKQGAFATHVLFVNQGLIKVCLRTGKDKQINIRLVKQGDIMAFSTLFGNEKHEYSGIALVDSVICMINKEALKKVLMRNPEFAMKITSRNSFQENRYLEIIKNVTYKQMRGKLASAILYLCSNDYNDESIFKHLTRQDIADFASITLESTVKFLKEFEKEGIISLSNRDIGVIDLNVLKDLSEYG
jgi:CRP/FNR family transcriptional regulator